jgi:hypothetical protein
VLAHSCPSAWHEVHAEPLQLPLQHSLKALHGTPPSLQLGPPPLPAPASLPLLPPLELFPLPLLPPLELFPLPLLPPLELLPLPLLPPLAAEPPVPASGIPGLVTLDPHAMQKQAIVARKRRKSATLVTSIRWSPASATR